MTAAGEAATSGRAILPARPDNPARCLTPSTSERRLHTGNASHIAALDPAVALDLADQWDAMAAAVEEAGDGPLALVAAGLAEPSVKTARTYLRSDR